MIYQYISELRTKPDHHKHRFALITSGAVTAAIFVAWFSVLLPNDSHRIVAENRPAVIVETSPENSPIATLKRETAQVFSAMKDLLNTEASNVNLQEEYNQMKNQVETGQIKITPDSPVNP